MGYTHYWYRGKEIPSLVMGAIIADFKKVVPTLGVELADGMGEGEAKLTAKEAWFNGKRPEDYETFHFPQVLEKAYDSHKPVEKICYYKQDGTPVLNSPNRVGKWFEFCKTAQRPYDIAVCAFLIIAKHHLKDDIIIASDGELSDWQPAIDKVTATLNYGSDFALDGGD